MKRINLFLFCAFSCSAFAQVGIRTQDETLPTGYVFPNPSAALDVYSTKKGLLLPRVSLGNYSLTNTSNPITSPTQGLLLYNSVNGSSTSGITKGLYFWEADSQNGTNKYNKVFNFSETPKASTITVARNIKILNNAGPGDSSYITESSNYPSDYSTILTLDSGYSQDIRMDKMWTSSNNEAYGVVLQKGTYSIEINFFFNIPSSYITTRSRPIRLANQVTPFTNADFYDVGYFFDIHYKPFTSGTTSSNPNTSGYYQLRSENHILTRPGFTHTATSINVLTLTEETFIIFGIGRMQGVSYYDASDLLGNSYIEIKKISY